MNQGGGAGPRAPMRDFIKLESSLFTLTKKCTKTCTKFLENRFNFSRDQHFYSKLRKDHDINQTYNSCLMKCTSDYATLNKHVRVRFMEDLDKTQQANQEVFDDFYRNMAERLARIIGTEEDKVNCPFYFKIGACRHGDNCTRTHLKPTMSQTVVLTHMYDNPPAAIALSGGTKLPEEMIKETVRHFEDFYEEVFLELSNFGEIEDVTVCDNIGDHIIGNVYVKYYDENDSERAMKSLTGRYYAGKLIMPEYSPVTNFRDAKCRQYEEGSCSRGGYCNFMHLKYVSKSFKKSLMRQMYEEHPEYNKKREEREAESKNKSPEESPSRKRSRSPKRRTRRSRSRSKGQGGGRDRNRDGHRDGHRDRERDRERDRDRKNKKRKDRSRSRSTGAKSRSRSPASPKKGGFPRTSEERRAMIASWNQEAENGGN